MSMAAIERARLATCEELLRDQAALIKAMREELDALKPVLRPTLKVRHREAAQPV